MTPAERLEAAGRWLAAAGGQATPGELGAALGYHHGQQARVGRELREQGLVEGARGQLQLTAAGWARFAAAGVDSLSGAGEVLDRVLADWPQAHRAFVELGVSSVIARHHLGDTRPEGHLGFMAIGPTATGKSSAAAVVCHLFGWPLEEHLVDMPSESTGSLLGRREQEAGGGWRWDPAPMTRLPFVLLDEFDKADRGVQLQAWRYFQGRLRVRMENGVVELRPTPMLTANLPATGDRYAALRPEYRRRSVVLDTSAMAGRGREIGRLRRQLSPADRLNLDRLTPPTELDPAALAVLEAAEEWLEAAGREEFDLPGLELATLGRCALLGEGADHGLAALSTVVAYLQVTETRAGQVRHGWGLDAAAVRQHYGAGADVNALLAAVERSRQDVAQAREAVHEGRQRKERAELAVLEAGEALAARCRRLRDQLDRRRLAELPDGRRDDAAGLRKVLGVLAGRAAQVSTAASLADVQAQAADPLARGAQLVAEAAATRQQRIDDAANARRQAQEDRRASKQTQAMARMQAAAIRRQRADAAAQVAAAATPLERLYVRKTTRPDEDPLAVLVRLRVAGYVDQPLLTYVPPPAEQPPATVRARLARVLQPLPTGHWQVTGSSLRFPGSPSSCPALATWGPATRAVLAPTLAALHRQEDDWGGRARKSRPRVDPAADAAAAAPAQHALPSSPLAAGRGMTRPALSGRAR